MLLEKSVIILANGVSKFSSGDKGLLELDNKPLINHVFDVVKGFADEVIVVTNSERAKIYQKILLSKAKLVIDECKSKGSLMYALAGFKSAQGKYSLLLPDNVPLVSKEIISFLFDCCVGKTAVIPRWSSDEIEPLQAVYQTKLALETACEAVEAGETELDAMVSRLRGVRYISSLVFEEIDPEMHTFFRVNTPLDLKKAALILAQGKNRVKRKK